MPVEMNQAEFLDQNLKWSQSEAKINKLDLLL